MMRKLSIRDFDAWIVGLTTIGATVAGIYFIITFGALWSPTQSTAYRDITWNDLLEQQPPPQTKKSIGIPPSLGPDPWEKFADDIESAIVDSAAKKPVEIAQSHQELSGADVRLAGYIVPLEDSPERLVTEFFLVPYVGACIHVPPPPPDQIVYIKFPMGLRVDNIYQPFQVEGTLHLEVQRTDLASSAYTMVADEVNRYDPQSTQQ